MIKKYRNYSYDVCKENEKKNNFSLIFLYTIYNKICKIAKGLINNIKKLKIILFYFTLFELIVRNGSEKQNLQKVNKILGIKM